VRGEPRQSGALHLSAGAPWCTVCLEQDAEGGREERGVDLGMIDHWRRSSSANSCCISQDILGMFHPVH